MCDLFFRRHRDNRQDAPPLFLRKPFIQNIPYYVDSINKLKASESVGGDPADDPVVIFEVDAIRFTKVRRSRASTRFTNSIAIPPDRGKVART